MDHITNVRLVKVERDSYILSNEDGTCEYMVPVAAYNLSEGLIIPIDLNNSIRVCLSSQEEATANINCDYNVENHNTLMLTENVPVTSPTSSKKKWLSVAIKNLLHHYSVKRPLFLKTSIRADEVWGQIKRSMEEDGFNFTVDQIKTKFSKLKQNYMKVKDNNSQTGAAPMDFPWLDEFDGIFSKNHNVQPIAIASSSSFTPITEDPLNKTIIPKKNKPNVLDKVLSSINKMKEEREAREQQRAEERKEERNKILDELRRGNDLFEKLIDKVTK